MQMWEYKPEKWSYHLWGTMASMYERVLFYYKVVKAWDDNNTNLSECYKLQSNDPQNKSCIEIHKDNGKYGIEFTINKTFPKFN